MALTDSVRVALRLSTSVMDEEVDALVAAAKADLDRIGIPGAAYDEEDPHPLARMAVLLYCKGHFGYDNDEADRFLESYEQVVKDLLNSPTLIEAMGESSDEEGSDEVE